MGSRPFFGIEAELEALQADGLLRAPRRVPAGLVDLCSNDYFGLGRWPLEAGGEGGAGAAPLVSGHTEAHEAAEAALRRWLRVDAITLFSSGYAANLGTVQALVGRGDLVVSDALNHASIVDGCRLSRAEIAIVPHLDLEATEGALVGSRARRKLVVVESYFGMDADGPSLRELRALCDRHGAIFMVDEAHALGCFGDEGRGRCAEAGVTPDVLVGTLGKSIGLHGAFVAGSETLRTWLWNRARSFVFSTGISPAVAGDVGRRVDWIRSADEPRAHLSRLAHRLRGALAQVGLQVVGVGHVVPVVLGHVQRALEAAAALEEIGYFAPAIRPPTVPTGGARVRVTLHAELAPEHIDRVAERLSRFT